MNGAAIATEAAELDRELAGETAAPAPGGVDADNAADPQGAAGEPDQAPAAGTPAEVPLDKELAGCVVLIGTVYGALGFPSVAKVLDEERAAAIGAKVAPVLVKYGLDKYFRGFAWRVELEAAMVVAPTVLAVRAAIRADQAAAKAASSPAPAAAVAPLGDTPGARPGGESAPSSATLPDTRGMLQPVDQAPSSPSA